MIVAAIGWGLAEFVGFFGIDTVAQSAHIGGLIGGAIFVFLIFLKINPKFLYALIAIPIIATFFVGMNMPSEIDSYTEVPEGFELIDSELDFKFKLHHYTKEDSHIFTLTTPSRGKSNLAEISRNLEQIVLGVYTDAFEKDVVV